MLNSESSTKDVSSEGGGGGGSLAQFTDHKTTNH